MLSDQGIEVEDAEAFFKAWVELYGRASVWHQYWQNGRPDPNISLNGPLPEWHSTYEIWRRQFNLAFEKFGVTGDAEAAAAFVRDRLAQVDPYPDAHDTIEGLAQRGYLLGLLSNADEDFLQSALSRGRLRFSVIQTSESLRAYKPHRAIFEALCRRLSCTHDEVLYVGDSANADMRGALNAGLRTAWVHRDGDKYPEGVPEPDVTIGQLSDLLSVLSGRY
jgi:2-haloalkanoic acid dehalogenase type II